MANQVVVIGAGVIGAATALALAEKGLKVTLIEQGSRLGQGASGNNGGQLSYNYSDAMASPQILRSLPRLMLALDPAFRMKMPLDWNYLRWGLQFLVNCRQSKSDANTLAVLALALQSREVLHDWIKKYQFEFKHKVAQKLHLFQDRRAFDHARYMVDLKNSCGGNQQCLGLEQALAVEPNLASMNAELIGAVHSAEDEVGDVRDFTLQAIQKSVDLGGGELLLNTCYQGIGLENARCKFIKTNQGDVECDRLVICAGYWSQGIARQIGIKCPPIIPVAGYSLDYPASNQTPQVSLTDTASRMVLCKLGDRLRVAGVADVGFNSSRFRQKRIEILRNSLMSRFPNAGHYQTDPLTWIGARPMTANSQPLIERSEYFNIYLNSGHGMLGWTLAAGSAERLTKLVLQ